MSIFGPAALALGILALAAAPTQVLAAAGSKCAGKTFVLWGDATHDDTAALNAWFRGDAAVWGESGRSVGAQITDHVFRLSAPVYIPSGTGRTIAHFQFVWPERNEFVAGGTVITGGDPDRPPVAIGLTKIGVGPGEGVPYPSKTPTPADPDPTDCLVS